MFSHLKNNFLTTAITYGFLVGIVIWIVMFLQVALQLRDTVHRIGHINFGPLELASISRVDTQNGVVVTVGLEQHLFVYFALWLTAGLLIGLALSYTKKRHTPPRRAQPQK